MTITTIPHIIGARNAVETEIIEKNAVVLIFAKEAGKCFFFLFREREGQTEYAKKDHNIGDVYIMHSMVTLWVFGF